MVCEARDLAHRQVCWREHLQDQLVELHAHVPLPDPLEDLKLGEIPPVPLRAFLEDQGFNSLLARLNNGSAPSGRAPNMMPAVRTAPMPQDKPLTLDLPAIDRGLAGMLVAMTRLSDPQMTPAGVRPARRERSTLTSVWPGRTSTPPLRARRGNT